MGVYGLTSPTECSSCPAQDNAGMWLPYPRTVTIAAFGCPLFATPSATSLGNYCAAVAHGAETLIPRLVAVPACVRASGLLVTICEQRRGSVGIAFTLVFVCCTVVCTGRRPGPFRLIVFLAEPCPCCLTPPCQ